MTDSPAPLPPGPARRRRLRRGGLYGLAVLLVLSGALALGVFFMLGRAMTLPEWLRDRIEARIAQELPQAAVGVGSMVFVLDQDWVPRVRLRDITLRNPAGTEIVSFNELRASFALRPLIDGKLQPRDIALSGVFVTLRRGADGRVSLRGGIGERAPAQGAVNLPDLITQLDTVLQRPELRALGALDVRALTLRYVDAGTQRAWTLDGGRLRLTREGSALELSADLAVLSGGAGVATLTANYTSVIGARAAQFGVRIDGVAAEDIAAQGPAFAWLGVLRAPISGAVRSGLKPDGSFEPVNATLQIGAGVLQPDPRTKPIPFDGARSYFSYDPARNLLRFDELSLRSQWVSLEASGSAMLGGTGAGTAFSDMVGQFALRNLVVNPDDLYAAPVGLDAADIDFQLKLDPFRLQIGRLKVTDKGRHLRVAGDLEANPEGWRVALDGRMDALDRARLMTLWPVALKPQTRTWLAENLRGGEISDIDLGLRMAPDAPPKAYVAFEFADATVRFQKSMPPITGARGHFSLLKDRLVVSLVSGEVAAPDGGPIDIGGSSFILPDVTIRGATPAEVRLSTASSLTAVLSLLDQPPLQVLEKAGMPIALAEAQARLEGTLSLPLIPDLPLSAVKFTATGNLRDVTSTALVPARTLTADRLQVSVDETELRLAGSVALDGVPLEGSWVQPIGKGADPARLRGTVALSAETLEVFGVALPPGTLAGRGQGRLALDLVRGSPPRFSLTSDLQGIRLEVPQISWVKPAARGAALEVSGVLGSRPRIDRLEIAGAGLSATGSVSLLPGGGLERVRFDRVRLDDWLDVPVDLVGQGAGRPIQVVLRGGALDLRRAAFATGNSSSGGAPMQLALDRLQVSDTIALTGMRGAFVTSGGLDGQFEARINGGAEVSGQVIPQNGRIALRLTAQDAGGILRSAGLMENVFGGTLSLTLLPVGTGGAFDGRLSAQALRVRNAPGMAALLNAVSVVGLINELNGDGIYFDDVEGTFRLTSDQLTLTEASAVGASMGLSMDGVYGLKSNRIAMQGVITPVYMLNGIGSVLTRRGEGLIGFNYTLRGMAKAPQVSVNPLSALAPGMFRNILRAAPPEVPQVEGVTGMRIGPSRPDPEKPVVRGTSGR